MGVLVNELVEKRAAREEAQKLHAKKTKMLGKISAKLDELKAGEQSEESAKLQEYARAQAEKMGKEAEEAMAEAKRLEGELRDELPGGGRSPQASLLNYISMTLGVSTLLPDRLPLVEGPFGPITNGPPPEGNAKTLPGNNMRCHTGLDRRVSASGFHKLLPHQFAARSGEP